MASKTVDLGYFTDGYGVVFATVDVEISRHDNPATTTAHLPIKAHSRLSISGQLRQVTNGRRVGNGIAFGQIAMSLREMTPCDRFGSPAEMAPETARLLDIWELWHLNDMRAGCMHQSRQLPKISRAWYPGKTWEPSTVWEVQRAIETAKCPCGYSYGSSWLVDVLPPSIHDWYASL
jgi:hypothetical protein